MMNTDKLANLLIETLQQGKDLAPELYQDFVKYFVVNALTGVIGWGIVTAMLTVAALKLFTLSNDGQNEGWVILCGITSVISFLTFVAVLCAASSVVTTLAAPKATVIMEILKTVNRE